MGWKIFLTKITKNVKRLKAQTNEKMLQGDRKELIALKLVYYVVIYTDSKFEFRTEIQSIENFIKNHQRPWVGKAIHQKKPKLKVFCSVIEKYTTTAL